MSPALADDLCSRSSDHSYPRYTYNLNSAAKLAASSSKAYINGEYDWTDRYYHPLLYLAVLAPVVLAALLWVLPARWWPCWIGAGCRGRGRARRPRGGYEGVGNGGMASNTDSKSQTELVQGTYPPVATLPTTPPPKRGRGFLFRRWHLALLLVVVLCPLLGGLISRFLPSTLASFLSTTTSLADSDALSGSLYWSLFGRDDQCCAYVDHDDGYTLHYPSNPAGGASGTGAGSGQKVVQLTKQAWQVRGETPAWLDGSLAGLKMERMPVVACLQAALAVPANATWTGGNGTLVG